MRQGELNFDVAASTGYDRWKQERLEALNALARKLGLPLGHQVEVWLKGDIRLRGQLALKENLLFLSKPESVELELQIDRVSFTASEMTSCVRLD